jgi:hypothetical protein
MQMFSWWGFATQQSSVMQRICEKKSSKVPRFQGILLSEIITFGQ